MAVVMTEGFDLYSATVPPARRAEIVAASDVRYETGRFGGVALSFGASTNFRMSLGVARNTLTVGVACRIGTTTSVLSPFTLRNGASNSTVMSFWMLGTGEIQICRGPTVNTNVIATLPVGAVPRDVWTYLEIEVTRAASGGALKIWVDGFVVYDGTGLNTGSAAIDQFACTVNGNAFGNTFIDDFYLLDTLGAIGPCRVELLVVDSDEAVAWTPSSGVSNFAMVDEHPSDGDVTFVSADAVGTQDYYGVTPLSATPAQIFGVQTVMVARMDDAGPRAVRCNLNVDGDEVLGTSHAMASGFLAFPELFTLNPVTSAPWTDAQVNGLLVGPEVAA